MFGGGKSFYGVREVIEELRFGSRCIVTNLPIKLPDLREYLHLVDKHAQFIDINKRVRVLSEDEAREFYLHRETGLDIEPVSSKEAKAGNYQNYPSEAFQGAGVMYILDEADKLFHSRNFQNYSMACSFYLSQHRKLNDEVMFIAPVLQHLDKQLREMTAEFIYVKNTAHQKMLGFRGPGYLLVKAYNFPVTAGRSDVPAWTKRYALDKKMATCYDTMSGIGVSGRKSPETVKKKGLSIWWMVPVALIFIGGLMSVPYLLNSGVTGFFKGQAEKALPDGDSSSSPAAPAGSDGDSRSESPTRPISPKSSSNVPHPYLDLNSEPRRYRSLSIFNDRVRVVLDNGAIVTHDDPWIDRIDSQKRVWIAGIPFLPPLPPEPETFHGRDEFLDEPLPSTPLGVLGSR